MKPEQAHQLAREFFAAIGRGDINDSLVTPDFRAWILTSGDIDLARFTGGIRALAAAVKGDLVYEISSLTAEDDRVVAEVRSDWELVNGQRAQNRHVFLFTLREGRVAAMSEYMDPVVPRETLGPLIQQLMAQGQQ